MLTTGHVDVNTKAGDLTLLSDAERSAIAAIYRENNFFLGT